jgi:hypothetical protein
MNTGIKGYCCEVTQEQWDELVRVADEVGIPVWKFSRPEYDRYFESKRCALIDRGDNDLVLGYGYDSRKPIPYPDFLAKMKGEECEGDPFTASETLAMAAKGRESKWQPKAGEMVEVSGGDDAVAWYCREFIATRGGKHFCWTETGTAVSDWCSVRPLRPTITRTEAEQLLNKRIID